MATKATVFHPTTGERKVVTVGDPQAFAGGYVLETPTDNFAARSQGRSLSGTLPSEPNKDRTLGVTTDIESTRSLPQQTSNLEAFKDTLKIGRAHV